MKGDIPTYERGRILGHEGVGVIDKFGVGARKFDWLSGNLCLVFPYTERVNIAVMV